eukprot:scaffold336_cov384-Prasinococcus_capsulatus_cf.AAC.3
MVSLVIALIIGVYLRYKGWQTLHSAGAALLLGVIVGLVTRLVNRVEAFRYDRRILRLRSNRRA